MQEGKKQRIEFLDYLKAVCVIMVIITHYGWEDKTSPFFTMLINMAVPVFMIVSGYNFAMSNRKKADGNLEKMYGWNMMKPKLIRFLLPFLPFVCLRFCCWQRRIKIYRCSVFLCLAHTDLEAIMYRSCCSCLLFFR